MFFAGVFFHNARKILTFLKNEWKEKRTIYYKPIYFKQNNVKRRQNKWLLIAKQGIKWQECMRKHKKQAYIPSGKRYTPTMTASFRKYFDALKKCLDLLFNAMQPYLAALTRMC